MSRIQRQKNGAPKRAFRSRADLKEPKMKRRIWLSCNLISQSDPGSFRRLVYPARVGAATFALTRQCHNLPAVCQAALVRLFFIQLKIDQALPAIEIATNAIIKPCT